MSTGREDVGSPILLTQSTSSWTTLRPRRFWPVRRTCRQILYEEFKEQLERNPAGWYETRLSWKANQTDLPTNETGSIRRLEQLVRKLHRDGQYEEYGDILYKNSSSKELLSLYLMSFVKRSSTSRKRESVEWTQNRLWCLRERKEQPAILKRLPNLGPPLQNRLWDILVRSRFYPVLLTGDLKKAFLHIRIKEEERDVLRFHWKPSNSDEILIFCFTWALFGMTCSPFLLERVINQHLDTWERQLPEFIKEPRDNLYVDDLLRFWPEGRLSRSLRLRELLQPKFLATQPSKFTNGTQTYLSKRCLPTHNPVSKI